MKEITLTLRGWAAKEAVLITNDLGRRTARFRMGVTPSRWDALAGAWVDQATEWFTVYVYRESAALNVARCIRKGMPLVVTGRFFSREREVDGKRYLDKYVAADAVGVDLSYGQCAFTRTVKEDESVDSPLDHEIAEEPSAMPPVGETDLGEPGEAGLVESLPPQPALVGAVSGASEETPPF